MVVDGNTNDAINVTERPQLIQEPEHKSALSVSTAEDSEGPEAITQAVEVTNEDNSVVSKAVVENTNERVLSSTSDKSRKAAAELAANTRANRGEPRSIRFKNNFRNPFKRQGSGGSNDSGLNERIEELRMTPKEPESNATSPRKSSKDFIQNMLKNPFSKKDRRNDNASGDSIMSVVTTELTFDENAPPVEIRELKCKTLSISTNLPRTPEPAENKMQGPALKTPTKNGNGHENAVEETMI